MNSLIGCIVGWIGLLSLPTLAIFLYFYLMDMSFYIKKDLTHDEKENIHNN